MAEEKILFEGIPLSEVVEQLERKEIADLATEEANKFKPAIISNLSRRPKYETKVAHGKAYTFSELERFGYLIEKGSVMDGKARRIEFRRFPVKTQEKLNRLFNILKALPDNFTSSEIKPSMKAMGIGDYQRYVLMLYHGRFLSRAGDIKKFTYSKTDIAKLPEDRMANALMDNRDKMFGYSQADPEKKMMERAKKIEEDGGLAEISHGGDGDAIDRDDDGKGDETMAPKVYQKNGHPHITLAPPPQAVPAQRVEAVERTAAPQGVGTGEGRKLFMEMADDYEQIKAVLPNLTVKDFLVMWLRGSGKA